VSSPKGPSGRAVQKEDPPSTARERIVPHVRRVVSSPKGPSGRAAQREGPPLTARERIVPRAHRVVSSPKGPSGRAVQKEGPRSIARERTVPDARRAASSPTNPASRAVVKPKAAAAPLLPSVSSTLHATTSGNLVHKPKAPSQGTPKAPLIVRAATSYRKNHRLGRRDRLLVRRNPSEAKSPSAQRSHSVPATTRGSRKSLSNPGMIRRRASDRKSSAALLPAKPVAPSKSSKAIRGLSESEGLLLASQRKIVGSNTFGNL